MTLISILLAGTAFVAVFLCARILVNIWADEDDEEDDHEKHPTDD